MAPRKTSKRARPSSEVVVGSISKKRKQNDCEDYLSNLPDDLLRDVFKKLTHADLDELSTVSRKISHFATIARPIVVKDQMETFKMRYDNGTFHFTVHKKHLFNPYASMSVQKMESGRIMCKKWKGWEHEMKGKPSTDVALGPSFPLTTITRNSIEYLFERYSCEYISFRSVIMTDSIMSFFGKILSKKYNLIISMDLQHPTHSEVYYKKVLCWVTSLNLRGLNLSFSKQLSGQTYTWLLRKIENTQLPAVENLTIAVIEETNPDVPVNVNFPSEEPCSVLATMRNVIIPTLVIDKTSFLEIIKKRITNRRVGLLRVCVSQRISEKEIVSAIKGSVEVSEYSEPGNFTLYTKDGFESVFFLDGDPVIVKYDDEKTNGRIAPVLPLTNQICNSIEYLFKRFSCKNLRFFSGLMDHNVMSFFGSILANIQNLDIEFNSMINVRREYSEVYYMQVLDWIASLKARALTLYFNRQLTGEIYASFLRKLAQSSPNDNIYSQEYFPKVHFPSEEPISYMAMVRCVEIPTLVLDKLIFLQIIKKRIDDRKVGRLRVIVPQPISRDDVVATIGDYVEEATDCYIILRTKDTFYVAIYFDLNDVIVCLKYKKKTLGTNNEFE